MHLHLNLHPLRSKTTRPLSCRIMCPVAASYTNPDLTPDTFSSFIRSAGVFAALQPWKRIKERQSFRLTVSESVSVKPGLTIAPGTAWVVILGNVSELLAEEGALMQSCWRRCAHPLGVFEWTSLLV